MAGVYIDGELKAFTVGSLNERENMAVIHIEKADPEINGLYQFINQQFLVHEFPDVALVNREDGTKTYKVVLTDEEGTESTVLFSESGEVLK